MSIVTLNKGAQITKPSDYYGSDSPDLGQGIFEDFLGAPDATLTTTSSPAVVGTHGSALYLDAADEVETATLNAFQPTAGESFAGAARVKIVHGTPMVTKQNILFGTDSTATPTERIGFELDTNTTGSGEFTVTCAFDDGTTDGSVTLAESELPGGSEFAYDAYHVYSVVVDCDTLGKAVAKFYIDASLVKTIRESSAGAWAAAGMAWVQTNLTTSSTVDQAIDWISVGSSRRP